MNTVWVLIILTSMPGVDLKTTTIKYNSEIACNEARKEIRRMYETTAADDFWYSIGDCQRGTS
jgi:hypothetical protein